MKIEEIIRFLYYFLMNILTALVNIFIRRDKSIMIMGAWYGRRFGGNSRYLFQYLSENKERYGLKRIIWLTREEEILQELREMGYEVYMMKSLKGFYYHFKAGIHAISVNMSSSSATSKRVEGDLMGELSLGATKFFLNHGTSSLKGNMLTEYENLSLIKKAIVRTYEMVHSIFFIRHFMLYPGGWDKMIFLSASSTSTKRECERHVKSEKVRYVNVPLPELCGCVKCTKKENEILQLIKKWEKTILYVPTYRTTDKTGYTHPLNNPIFCDYLKRKNILWIDKLHPGAKEFMNAKNYGPDYSLKLPTSFDINIIMNKVDIVITDYSSVYQNAFYFYRKVIFYIPDIKNYIKEDKGLIKEYFDDITDIDAYNETELQERIEQCCDEKCMEKYDTICEKMFIKYFDGKRANYSQIVESMMKFV